MSKQQQTTLTAFSSLFFTTYYSKLQSSIEYLFVQKHQSHSYNEPNWMFDYIQEVFVANYQWLRANILHGLHGDM